MSYIVKLALPSPCLRKPLSVEISRRFRNTHTRIDGRAVFQATGEFGLPGEVAKDSRRDARCNITPMAIPSASYQGR